MIKAVIFDMFETLITHFESPLYMGKQIANDIGISEQKFREIWNTTDDERTLGKRTLEDVIEEVMRVNDCYTKEVFDKIISKRKASKIECFHHLHPEIIPMFEALKEQNVKIGLITNCYYEERDVIKDSCLFGYLDVVCMSCELGMKKPEIEIFETCVSGLGVKMEECLYIGDGGSYELEAAKAFGMHTMQATWYLKDGVNQPAKRKAEFKHAKTPMDVVLEVLNQLHIPFSIYQLISGKSYKIDEIGMSGNKVLLFEDMVLKIEADSVEVTEQVVLMKWLEEKLPIPRVLAHEISDGKSYLLMSKIGGEMSCDTYYLEQPHVLLEALANGLKMLWEVDISKCPKVQDLDALLTEARRRVEQNLVDVDNTEPTTFGEGGFESPKHLLEWLEDNQPTMEPVFIHGDYCLPNVFLKDGQVEGFIDLGKAGVGDKWFDIALCYRSLKHNFDGTYGGKVYEGFNPDLLFEKLGIEPDWKKIRYYILLDELF